jgi:pyruvate,water dikinase
VETPLTTTYTCPDGTPFPVEWPEPEMAKLGWRWDQMHNPLPFTPLSEELGEDLDAGFRDAMDATGAPAYGARVQAHGYRFFRGALFDGDSAVRAAAAERDFQKRAHRLLDLWETSYRPEVDALTRSIVTWDDPAWDLRQALNHFDQIRAARKRHGELHVLTLGLTTSLANRLIDFCIAEFGSQGAILAGELMQGYPNRSLDSAKALWDLSRLALQLPRVADLLRSKPAGEVLAALAAVTGGGVFRKALDTFLVEFGHRNEAFTELVFPRWIEDPRFPLLIVRRYMDLPETHSPQTVHAKQERRRLELTAELAARLGAGSEKAATFRDYCHTARQRTILIEDHNFAIDQKGMSSVRVPCLALGRRLVDQGSVAAAEDIFYLRLAHIERAATSPVDLRPVVAADRAERDRWLRILPPASIGAVPPQGSPVTDTFFGKFKDEPDPPGMVRGIAGSPGSIRGIARVIGDLSEADRLAPGEILVTYATAPPWTPLFAIAGGIVTDAGGVLSHCAVVAREYGIPAVVGARTATAAISDGMLITVDGTNGIVRLEA